MVPFVSSSVGKFILDPVLTFFVYILNSLVETSITKGESSSLGPFLVFSMGIGVSEYVLESSYYSTSFNVLFYPNVMVHVLLYF